ncbi:hypothetical protein MML48_8g00010323 [Holotrichia oblita]|uniref:Uncharacterized protein n=1 Tax=Holotrichia oblita TaxID=644536 RepID=A0ACB9SVB8_HOLOL|nr:hypothetical protein MML48_8g00010323 [Holotrichia oblita]
MFIIESYFRSEWVYYINQCLQDFRQRFPNLPITSAQLLSHVHACIDKFQETGAVTRKPGGGAPKKRTAACIEDIRQRMDNSPKKSIPKLSQQIQLSVGTCHTILKKKLKLYPYKMKVVHKLTQVDFGTRTQYCQWFLDNVDNDNVLDKCFFTDEAWFHLSEMAKYFVLFLASLWIIPNSLSSSRERFPSIAVFAQNIIKSGWKTLEDRSYLKTNKTIEQKQARFFRKVIKTGDILGQLEQPISSTSFDVFKNLIRSTTNNSRYESLVLDFFSCMYHIEANFDQLQVFAENGDSQMMVYFAYAAIKHQVYSIEISMRKIHEQIAPQIAYVSRGGLMKLLADNMDAFDEIVRIAEESPNQLLYNLFNKIALTQIKGYAIVQFSYAILEIQEKGHYLVESQLANANIRKTLRELVRETIRATAKLPRDYWRSDPEDYIRGENYLEISGLLQGYVVNEKLLNKNGRCWGRCETFKESNPIKCQKDSICNQLTRCNGKLYSCRSLSTMDMQICLPTINSTRRYDYIEYENRKTLGVKSTCSTSIIDVPAWIGSCHYCMCFCDEHGARSDRYINLRQVVSDTKKNKVVTGIRFAKRNRMIHLQVQQGELLPYGVINATSLEWVPVDNFKINDRYVFEKEDYLKITWKDRAIDLHVLQVNDEINIHKQVLTGVRFTSIKFGRDPNNKNTHLNLEIRTTKFHFESGKLFRTKGAHKWIRNLNTEFSPHNPR